MSAGAQPNRYVDRPAPSSLADVIDTILDKGLVIDVYARVSLLGIEIVTLDARVAVASVDTYLRFAQAVQRLDLQETQIAGVTGLVEELNEAGARGAVSGGVEGVTETVKGWFSGEDR